jgi:hypothetical protein
MKQGDLGLLKDPVAEQLLRSAIPARLAYNWLDGTPRVVPIWFHWDGREFALGSPPRAPKLKALRKNPRVALTIDDATWPSKVLLVRGTATVETLGGVVPEYALAARRYFGEEQGKAWADQVAGQFSEMGRIAVRPEWVGILDFETRFPSALAG